MYSRGLCEDESDDAEEGWSTDDELGVRALELATRSINRPWRSWIASLCCKDKNKGLKSLVYFTLKGEIKTEVYV